jgi:hypothetical protein
VIGTAQPVSFAPSASDFTHIVSAPFAISLVFVMYSFSGWNAATYIIGEVRLPERNVPRAMLIGTLIVLVLYVALNAVFLHTAPIDKLAGQLDVARISGSYIFGEFGGRIVGAMICFGLISSISAMMWIGPRVMMTMGEDIPVLRAFARRSARRRAGLCHPVSAHGREPDAVYAQLRGRARIHPVLAAVLFVLRRARGHQAADHASRPAAAVSRLGIPGNAGDFPARDRLHDVLSLEGTAVALVPWSSDHVVRPVDLRRLSQAGSSRRGGRGGPRMKVWHSLSRAVLAVVMLLAAVAGVRAQTATSTTPRSFWRA